MPSDAMNDPPEPHATRRSQSFSGTGPAVTQRSPTASLQYDHPSRGQDVQERLNAELARATAELKAHMASWEYAFAMAGGCHGGREHPVHWATRDRTDQLTDRCRDLRARLAEFES
jgi:hypothetical protein